MARPSSSRNACWHRAIASAQGTTATKIGIVNTTRFHDPKAGITRLVRAADSVTEEFRADYDTSRIRRFNAVNKEIETLRKLSPTAAVPIDPQVVIAKFDEAEKLEREITAEQNEFKSRFEKRWQQVMDPIMGDILKAMEEFAKQHNYALVVDGSRSDTLLVALQDKVDATEAFIGFYNAQWLTKNH